MYLIYLFKINIYVDAVCWMVGHIIIHLRSALVLRQMQPLFLSDLMLLHIVLYCLKRFPFSPLN